MTQLEFKRKIILLGTTQRLEDSIFSSLSLSCAINPFAPFFLGL
jgi:hypothetical protein